MLPLTTFYRSGAHRSDVYKWDAFVTSWRFYNRAWQPQRHDHLPETSGTLWIHRGALTNQRCSLATGCGIMLPTSSCNRPVCFQTAKIWLFCVNFRLRWYGTQPTKMRLGYCTSILQRLQSCFQRCFQSCKWQSFFFLHKIIVAYWSHMAHRSGSILAQIIACCLMTPSHYLNQCWLLISEVFWHSPEDSFTESAQDIYPWYGAENY